MAKKSEVLILRQDQAHIVQIKRMSHFMTASFFMITLT